jgi:hypothetical protein
MPDASNYSADDILDKTLYASQRIPVYTAAPPYTGSETPIGYVEAGQPVGIVYSYLNADPTRGRGNLWWMFYPASNYSDYYYTEQVGGYYDVSSLRAQGVLSLTEKQAAADNANKPWYEQLISKYGPWILGTIVIAAAVKGFLSRPRAPKPVDNG